VDVPVSYALVSVVDGVVVRSWSGLIDPGRVIPEDACAVHGISTERARHEGMPLDLAVALVADALVAASRRGVPVVGMKLDFDLTMLDVQSHLLCGRGLVARGWHGPVLDAVVIDRHFDPERPGRRTLGDLCTLYGVDLERAHDAMADAIASVEVLFALAQRHRELREAELMQLHLDQAAWHRSWTQDYERWRRSEGLIPIDPREFLWPVAAVVNPAA
jgi:DNA polymerase-3 subunit epsilon